MRWNWKLWNANYQIIHFRTCFDFHNPASSNYIIYGVFVYAWLIANWSVMMSFDSHCFISLCLHLHTFAWPTKHTNSVGSHVLKSVWIRNTNIQEKQNWIFLFRSQLHFSGTKCCAHIIYIGMNGGTLLFKLSLNSSSSPK